MMDKDRLMTHRQCAELLAKGYGECAFVHNDEPLCAIAFGYNYSAPYENAAVPEGLRVRAWGSDVWYKPTVGIYEAFTGKSEKSVPTDGKSEFKIGKWGQAGYVFYDKGYYSDGWRYLECAADDLKVEDSADWDLADDSPVLDLEDDDVDMDDLFIFGFWKKDYDGGIWLKKTGTAVGDGMKNTKDLVGAMARKAFQYPDDKTYTAYYAARLCSIINYWKYQDWFLPSKDELNLMYENLKDPEYRLRKEFYWSSSEEDSRYAWAQDFGTGFQGKGYRSCSYRVRPVRAF